MANQIVWCDIPVLDLDRAVKFYSAVLGRQVTKQEFPGTTVEVLPHNDGDVAGA
jgi:predicted enzyme related to lactoylglutathione lyase